MRNPFSEEGTYVTAVQWGPTSGRLALSMAEPASLDIPNTAMMGLDQCAMWCIDASAFHSCFVGRAPGRTAVFVGDNGEVTVLQEDETFHEEFVTTGARSPRNLGHLRAGAHVGEDLVVVGMQRQVYRRSAAGVWSDWMDGLPTDEPAGTVSGLEAIAAISPDEVYAAGWDGELWRHDGDRWHRLASPTDRIITGLGHTAGSDAVYGCGRNGLVLRGRHDTWEVILPRALPDDLWSIMPFKGAVYAASLQRLYRITADRQVEVVDVDAFGADTFSQLICDGETLWSIGAKDFLAFDGQAWSRVA